MNFTPLPQFTAGHYVYIHTKATKCRPSVDSIFYVGKGVMPNVRGGVNRAWKTSGRSQYWQRVFRKHGRLIWIVQQGLTNAMALELESDLIEYLRSVGCTLANMNDGGSGGALQGETLERMRASLKSRFSSPEARKITSDATRRAMADPEVRRKLSEANKGKPRSAEVKESIRAKLTGRQRSERERAALTAGWADPAKAERRLKSLNAKPIRCQQNGAVFRSANEAARWVAEQNEGRGSATPILNCCKGIGKSAYGFAWCFAE